MNHHAVSKRAHGFAQVLAGVVMVLTVAWIAPATHAASDEAPMARAYMTWLQSTVSQIEKDLRESSDKYNDMFYNLYPENQFKFQKIIFNLF